MMKAISVKQPWATWIAEGCKTIETRRWMTSYRGPLLIVSSKSPDPNQLVDCTDDMLYGKALAIAELIDCRPMTMLDQVRAFCEVYPKAQAWVLEYIRPIVPFDVRGQLGLFEVKDSEIIMDCENCNGQKGGCNIDGKCF